MAIITLTSDMGLKDYYVPAVKGRILQLIPNAVIVDISHQIMPFNISEAAFVLRNVLDDFPDGTVHMVAVDPEERIFPAEPADDVLHVAVKYRNQFFVGADNGFFGLLLDDAPQEAVALSVPANDTDLTFPARNVFVQACCHIARGGALSIIGKPKNSLRKAMVFSAITKPDSIAGVVAHIDAYGNLITNIHETQFNQVAQGRPFSVYLSSEGYRELSERSRISRRYSDVEQGDMVVIFGSNGYLQIAINKGVEGYGGGAARLTGMHVNDSIRIEFDE